MPWTQQRVWTAFTYLLGLLPVFLLWHGNNAFYYDWRNHLWLIGYFGEYFRQHWAFPIAINTQQLAGIPLPVFYGYLFYPAAGLISSFAGCAFTLRLVCSLVFLLQVRQVSKTAELIAGNRFVACAVTVLVSFATYPLTNLYNRAAITEFVAASLVVSVCMMWLRIVRMDDPHRRRPLVFAAALTLTLAMGTHPITAILGGLLVGLLIVATLPFPHHGRDLWRTLGAAIALIFIVMMPWIYAVALYAQKIAQAGGWIILFTESLDSFLTRFSPLPWDPRIGTPEFQKWGTPYLDAQINFAMLILAVYLLYRLIRQRDAKQCWLAGSAFAGFAFVSFASLSRWFWNLLPDALKFIQFTYRLVTYADLLLLLTVLFALAALRRSGRSFDRPLAAALSVCLTLAAASVTVKLIHAYRVEEPNLLAGSGWPTTNRDALLLLPYTFYGLNGYAVKSGSRGITMFPATALMPAPFPVGRQDHFGEVLPLFVPNNNFQLIRTNVQIFPWNRIVWNGREIPFEETSTDRDLLTILPRSGTGTLQYVLRPDPVWAVLRTLSLWIAALWAAALPAWYYFRTYYFRTRNR